MSIATVARPGAFQVANMKRVALAVAPFLILLAWTAALRLPFYEQTDKDEIFFSVIASEWLRGGLPYVASFDIKPPGLFLIFAAAQTLFGASQATIKGMEIVAVAIAAYALYGLVKSHNAGRAALWIAILFPAYTLTLSGSIAANMILQLPFLIIAFAATLAAVREEASAGSRMRRALLAGLVIGAAGMIKQTAVLEATAIVAVLAIWGRQQRLRLVSAMVVGAALPAVCFAAYFASAGHFAEMFRAVLTYAAQRTDADVLAAYGPDLAYNFTLLGIVVNVAAATGPLAFLIAGALLLARRRPALDPATARMLAVAGIWLAAAVAGAFVGLGLNGYYLTPAVPPLLILGGVFYAQPTVSPRPYAFVLTLAAAILSAAVIDRSNLFTPNAFIAGDHEATTKVSQDIRALEPQPDDRLLVLNRGFPVYLETGLMPPTPFFHPIQMLGVFHTPSADPLGEALQANPRFIVVANPDIWHITELRSRIDRALDYLGKHYRVAAVVNGAKDSFTVYEFQG